MGSDPENDNYWKCVSIVAEAPLLEVGSALLLKQNCCGGSPLRGDKPESVLLRAFKLFKAPM